MAEWTLINIINNVGIVQMCLVGMCVMLCCSCMLVLLVKQTDCE